MLPKLTSDHILDPKGLDKDKIEALFEKVYNGNTILFLGAGASITDKTYLSKQIIEYYTNKLGIQNSITDIVKFVDILSSNLSFDRKGFDSFVKSLLEKLHYNEIHKTIMSIAWRIIITTNYDLLLEEANEEIKNTSEKAFELLPIRSLRDYEGHTARDIVKYVKLNGCMSDMGKYKFVFSNDDFTKANKYYKKVLNDLKNLSSDIEFLSIGYSYSDPLAQMLLERFDSFNYRNRRVIYNVDPSIQEDDYRLGFFSSNKICTIKMTGLEFFTQYKEWETKKYRNKSSSTILKINGLNKESIKINYKLAYNLKGYINQIGQSYEGTNIEEKDFYLGEEPNFNNIRKGHDVIRQSKIKESMEFIWNHMKNPSIMIPFIYLTGSFGTGKTTFIYRVLNDIINDETKETLAFEVIDIENFRRELALDLIRSLPVKNIIFYCNDLEIDSIYKAALSLRNQLSFEQIPDKSICFISSIRENILIKHRNSVDGTNMPEHNIDSPLTEPEVDDLLERLKNNSLIDYRDSTEKNIIKRKVIKELNSDTFVSLLDIVTDGKHILDLRNAYSQLSHKGKEAFIYTALLHRFGLFMPASLLKNIISVDWDEFTKKVLKAEGKGILLHEKVESAGLDPDIYFKTKHKIIADRLVNSIIKDDTKKYDYYLNIVRHLNIGYKSCRLLINLMKSLKENSDFDDSKINTLYDNAYKIFQDDAHFLLSYATNLQYRGSIDDLERGIELLKYAESLLPIRKVRDSRFIHRRGVVNFTLCKLFYQEERKELDKTFYYLDEAEDLLALKLQLDPTSFFSYTDYIQLLLWKIERLILTKVDEIKIKVRIEDLLSTALNTISSNQSRIVELQLTYAKTYQSDGDSSKYFEYLEDLYYNYVELRPYACILLYNYFQEKNNFSKSNDYLTEIEAYKDEEDIAAFLFKIYGRSLYDASIRTRFYQISRQLNSSKRVSNLRYNYFNYVAHFYDGYLQEAASYLQVIRSEFHSSNPEFNLQWLDSDGQVKVFEGYLIKEKSHFNFKIKGQPGTFRITKETYKENFLVGDKYFAELDFFINGVYAKVYKENP